MAAVDVAALRRLLIRGVLPLVAADGVSTTLSGAAWGTVEQDELALFRRLIAHVSPDRSRIALHEVGVEVGDCTTAVLLWST
jgi:hypothetical protein